MAATAEAHPERFETPALKGYLRATFPDLVGRLGKPADFDKVTCQLMAEWIVDFKGERFGIRDYKRQLYLPMGKIRSGVLVPWHANSPQRDTWTGNVQHWLRQ